MATDLEKNIRLILQEKNEKILPENIRDGVQIFDVKGTLTSPISEESYNNCLLLASEINGNSAVKTEYLYANGTFSTISSINAIYLAGTSYTSFTKTPNITLNTKGSYSSGSEYILVSNTKIDFTNYNKLEIKLKDINTLGDASYKNWITIALPGEYSDFEIGDEIENTIHYSESDFDGTLSLDITNITGEKYLFIHSSCRAYSSSKSLTISMIAIKQLLYGGDN